MNYIREMDDVLVLLKLALQNLAMVFHALDIGLCVLGRLLGSGVDVSVGEDCG